jgi:HD-like signal output (HDOD) protein
MESEEYFVAGMLHDLGKIPLNNRFPNDYVEALNLVDTGQCPLDRAENTIFDLDHSLVGGLIAEKWQLNENMNNVLCYHHTPEEATNGNRRLILTVALANLFANMMKIGSAGDLFPDKDILDSLLEDVGVDWPALSEMADQITDNIEKAKIFLQVSSRG